MTRPTPYTVNTLDMTLDELDEVAQLVSDGTCGRMAAIAFIGARRFTTRTVSLDEARKFTMRDVSIVEDHGDEDADEDPTPAP